MSNFTGQRTIPTFLDFHAFERPDVLAVVAESGAGITQCLTWSQLQALARQTANWMLSQGLRKGDSVVLHIPNSLDFYLLWLGACLAGAVTVPVDPRSTHSELNYIIDHSDARLVVTVDSSQDMATSASQGCARVLRVIATSPSKMFAESELGAEILAQPASPPGNHAAPLDIAGMLYTSGTTGKPKGVMLTHAVYLYGAEVLARGTGLAQSDRHLIPLPLHHAAAQCHAMVPSLVTGASIVILERFRPSKFMESAVQHQATRAALFAAPLRMLLVHHSDKAVPKTSLQLITFAQNLTGDEMSAWETRFGIPLIQVWGMTETASLPLMTPLHGPRNVMCMGLPVAGYEVSIVDAKENQVAPGQSGELVVRVDPGWSATPGYYKNPTATADLIHDGWLWSGDRAMQDENGNFHFLGRFKEMIKRSGENISPLEIEETLKTHPDVEDAAVVGVPDPVRDERVIAFVILRPARETKLQTLRDWCRQRLSAFKVPEEFHARNEFPRTSVGKIQRHHLRDAYLREHEAVTSMNSMEIFPNVHEIRSVFGDRYIQQYLFVGDRIVLLDAGVIATPEAAILPYLEKIGIAPNKLSIVVAMHADADHHGGLPAIKDASRSTLLACHAGDKKLIEDPERLYQDRYNFLSHDHGLGFNRDGMVNCPRKCKIDELLSAGQNIEISPGWNLQVWHVPGHSDGHLAIYDQNNRAAFTSDAVQAGGYPTIDGRQAFGPTYYAVDAYLATIQFLENQPIDHIFSGHWPACHGTDTERFLASSRAFVETADQLIKIYLSNRPRGATLKEILCSLSPKLGSWPNEAADFLQFALYGHMLRLEQLGVVVRSSKSPIEYALV